MSAASFGRALADARRRRRLSQRALGAAVGVRQSAVTQWERGITTPKIEHVFAVEQALGLPSGALARLLGYGPPSDTPPLTLRQPTVVTLRQPTVVDTILADKGLDDEQRQLLIGLYRQLQARPRRRRPSMPGP